MYALTAICLGAHVALPATHGTVSWFGGPSDSGVGEHEMNWTEEFYCRGLGDYVRGGDSYYIAMRWPLDSGPLKHLKRWRVKDWWSAQKILVVNEDGSRGCVCWVADWGPNKRTGRVADLGPAVLDVLDIQTDDTCRFWFAPQHMDTGPVDQSKLEELNNGRY